MNIYYTNSIKELARYLVSKYQEEFENIIVIMQNGLACKLLQNSIIEESKFPSMFFPEIIPILSQEDIDIAKYFHNVIPYNEAQLIFTKILLQSNLVKDFSNALNLSESLLKLYYEFIFNNVSLGNIRFLFSTDLSEQLYKNIEIIGKIFHDYEKYQNNNNKIDIAIFQRKLLLENNNNKKIILGFIDPYNKVIDQFIRNTLNNGGAVFSFKFNKIGPETNNKKIIVKELENEFEEAKYISSICNATSKILIISDNLAFNKLLIVNLISKNLDYTDYTYSGLNQNNFFDFFINIADFCLNKFDIKKLLLIMKSPLIINNYIYEIELNILRKKNYIPDFNFLIKESESLCSKESTEWLVYFYEIISKLQKPLKLDCHIGVARKLCKYNNINIEQYNEYFILLDQLSSHFNNLNLNDYISYLKTIEKDYVIKATNKDSSIIIIKAKDSRLIEDFDLLIIPSFTDNYWPKKIPSNDLLNDFMKAKIGILKAPDNSLDIILQLVYNKKTYITFARKYSSEIITKSRYLNLIKISIDKVKFPKITNLKEREKFIKFESKLMPDKISGTNIEMLIRNPYGFYAKHILKLRAIKPAIPELKFSEFGNFIHLILEKYTKNYNTDCNNKLDVIIEIALSIYKDLSRAYQTPISWISKFKKMAKSFIEFDETRRLKSSYILAESYGEMDISLGDRIVKITAIADRIEVSKTNEIYIMDYKTGTVPTIKSVNQGLSPQLIIESLIARYGYFENLNSKNVCKIIYVKITSSEPYIICTEMEINDDILQANLESLKKLLRYYYNNKEIIISKKQLEIAPDYNDYIYLMRSSFEK